MVIDEGELLAAVDRVVNQAGMPAHAENVSLELGKIADDGDYFDVAVVADDLAELEARGSVRRVRGNDWDGPESTPKTRIAYVRVRARE